jgi:hypothetical protein
MLLDAAACRDVPNVWVATIDPVTGDYFIICVLGWCQLR